MNFLEKGRRLKLNLEAVAIKVKVKDTKEGKAVLPHSKALPRGPPAYDLDDHADQGAGGAEGLQVIQ